MIWGCKCIECHHWHSHIKQTLKGSVCINCYYKEKWRKEVKNEKISN